MLTIFLSLILFFKVIPSTSSFMVRYGLNETDPLYWYVEARKVLQNRQRVVPLPNRPVKNVILFLGDGMGISTITASRILKRQIHGQEKGEDSILEIDQFTHSALIKTYNIDQQIPDSAATATAFLSGVKNHFYTIGVSGKVPRDHPDCDWVRANSIESIFTWALNSGKSTGLVTTARITHATPAAAYAHIQNRKWESNINETIFELEKNQTETNSTTTSCKDIALQLIEDDPGKRLNVIFGGGRKGFLPKSIMDPRGITNDSREMFGERNDGRNLIEEWLQHHGQHLNQSEYSFINSTKGLRELDCSKVKHVMGLFNYTHMEYDMLRDRSLNGEPSLSEMTEVAIRILSKNDQGFLLLVEGGLIDQAHHQGYATLSLYETLEFDRAIKKARQMLPDDDTLILVTADHSQPLVINGYSDRNNPINGTSEKTDANLLPFTTLMYSSGPGYKTMDQRSNMTISILEKNLHDLKYRFHSAVLTKKSYHSGEDVAIFAIGPMAHLFGGILEQSYIAHAIGYSSCTGPYRNEIHCRQLHQGKISSLFGSPAETYALFFIIIGVFVIILNLIFFHPPRIFRN